MPHQVIISAFPGTGKSHFCSKNPELECHDSDSSSFSWLSKGVRNPDFPNNYIQHIKSLDGIVFVSSHKEVREALKNSELNYFVVVPELSLKSEYLDRYKQRGSPQSFIDLIGDNWDNWVNEIRKNEEYVIVLKENQYISNLLSGFSS